MEKILRWVRKSLSQNACFEFAFLLYLSASAVILPLIFFGFDEYSALMLFLGIINFSFATILIAAGLQKPEPKSLQFFSRDKFGNSIIIESIPEMNCTITHRADGMADIHIQPNDLDQALWALKFLKRLYKNEKLEKVQYDCYVRQIKEHFHL